MVAIFDYDPRQSSPNTDIEVRPYRSLRRGKAGAAAAACAHSVFDCGRRSWPSALGTSFTSLVTWTKTASFT